MSRLWRVAAKWLLLMTCAACGAQQPTVQPQVVSSSPSPAETLAIETTSSRQTPPTPGGSATGTTVPLETRIPSEPQATLSASAEPSPASPAPTYGVHDITFNLVLANGEGHFFRRIGTSGCAPAGSFSDLQVGAQFIIIGHGGGTFTSVTYRPSQAGALPTCTLSGTARGVADRPAYDFWAGSHGPLGVLTLDQLRASDWTAQIYVAGGA